MVRSSYARLATAASVMAVVAIAALAATVPSGSASSVCREKKQAKAVLRNTAGERLGVVDFWADSACVTRVVAKIGQFNLSGESSNLSEGFHGFHIHTTGTCDPDATDAEGAASPFFTAGGHWNPDERNHGNHRGDLPPLLATNGGLARANVLTDRFTVNRLFDEDGSAVIVHAGADNLANVPAEAGDGGERYHSHVDDEMGPDAQTRATGDAGSRFACGVVKKIQ
ncbi:MAG TPA: superoxide dismutase family protein [Actinomycetota bacterium]|nr:superoxide dismutase family protein [Actinomycetota bacterium]